MKFAQNFPKTARSILEFQDKQSSVTSCLIGFAVWSGARARLDGFISIAPVPSKGDSSDLFGFLGRRIGVNLIPISKEDLQSILKKKVILVHRKSGYSFLLVGWTKNCFLISLPGSKNLLDKVPYSSDVLDDIASLHAINWTKPGPALKIKYRVARFNLIDFVINRDIHYSQVVVRGVNEQFNKISISENEPLPLSEINSLALLRSHESICPSLPEYYGIFRKINLRRTHVFLDHSDIPAALHELFETISRNPALEIDQALKFSSKIFVDFLTIHPFFNGNRRMGILLVRKYLEALGIDIDWNKMGRAVCYYCVRCASKGHFSFLLAAFYSNLMFID